MVNMASVSVLPVTGEGKVCVMFFAVAAGTCQTVCPAAD